MPVRGFSLLRILGIAAVVLVVASLAAAMPLVGLPTVKQWLKGKQPETTTVGDRGPDVELVPNQPDALRLPPAVVRKLGVQTITAEKATQPRTLELAGSLALDANKLARTHSRFAGEVVRLGEAEDVTESAAQGRTVLRPVRFGDRVAEGQLLAVVWSKDLGEKKSELVDALTQYRLDKEQLDRFDELFRKGGLSEASYRQKQRDVAGDLNAIAKAERTLLVWRLTKEEIAEVKKEAERILERKGVRDPEKERNWARVEVRAPFAGVVVEKNVAVGDIVDTSTDLFKIANVEKLTVWAHAYEEDLPALQALPQDRRRWTVRVKADPEAKPLQGTIEEIGYVIDPNQHTALVMGLVDNADGRLRAGQFITATVDLPPLPDRVALPTTALVEDGRTSIVFVQPDAAQPVYVQRRVVVVRRGQDQVYVRSKLTAAEEGQGLTAVRPGERVVTAGAVELKAALEDKQAAAKANK
jgi:cobalt-zinc-cadmium efflux system membrane fusion protein